MSQIEITRGLISVLRAAAARKDVRALARAARAAAPEDLVRAWPRLSPLARVAAFRALDRRTAAAVFRALPADGRWLAYLGEVSEGAAPLLEGKPRSDTRRLRRASSSERASMRKALA